MFKKILLGIVLLLIAAIIVPYIWIGMEDKPFDEDARALAPGQFADLPNGKIHYVWVDPAPEAANGETIMMLHGLYVPHFMFAANAQALAEAGYRVLLPDHYGHGFSDRPTQVYDEVFFDLEVSELLTALDINQPIYLAGQSTGGLIAAQFTAKHPEKIKGVMLIVPAGIRMHGEVDTPISKILRTPVIGDWFWRVFARKALRAPYPPPCAECGSEKMQGDPYIQAEYRGYFPAMLNILRNFPLRDQDEAFQALGTTGVPVIAIFGNKDETVDVQSAEILAAIAPNIAITVLENANHSVNIIKPEPVNQILLAFLKTMEPAPIEATDLPEAGE